jgi:hypothetical protein
MPSACSRCPLVAEAICDFLPGGEQCASVRRGFELRVPRVSANGGKTKA